MIRTAIENHYEEMAKDIVQKNINKEWLKLR